MKAAQAEVESVENTLDLARRDFAIWKASQEEAVSPPESRTSPSAR